MGITTVKTHFERITAGEECGQSLPAGQSLWRQWTPLACAEPPCALPMTPCVERWLGQVQTAVRLTNGNSRQEVQRPGPGLCMG